MGLMQKILGSADTTTGRRTQANPRMRGAGRGRTTRVSRGRVRPGRTSPSGGWGLRSKRKPPQSGLQRLISSVTGRR